MFLAKANFTFISGTENPNKEGKIYPKCNIDQNGEILQGVGCEADLLHQLVRFSDYAGTFGISTYNGNRLLRLLSVEPCNAVSD
jgi:hypothetical protein